MSDLELLQEGETTTPTPPLDPEQAWESHLHQASVALENAYARIGNLRQTILDLSPAPAQESDAIGPSHAAILVSTDPGVGGALQRLRSSLPPSVMARLEHFESTAQHLEEQSHESPRVFLSDASAYAPAPPHSPQPSSRVPTDTFNPAVGSTSPRSGTPRWAAYRSWLEYSLSRVRESDSDDPSTYLGRRVAAREAAGSSQPEPPRTDTSMSHLEHLLNMSNQVLLDLEVERARHRSTTATSASRPESSPPHSLNTSRVRDRSPHRILHNRASSPDRTRTVTFPTPAQIWRTRTSVPPSLSDSPWPFLDQGGETQPETRNYLVRRRLTADGDERVHNINLSDLDSIDDLTPTPRMPNEEPDVARPSATGMSFREYMDSYASAYNARTARLRPPQNLASASSQPAGTDATQRVPPRSRRGWARLDADGNEISPETEEELERMRAQERMRTPTRVRANHVAALLDQAATGRSVGQPQTFVPVTQTSLTPGLEGAVARVRINSAAANYHQETSPPQPSPAAPEPRIYIGSNTPFYVNPLPMPLADMMPIARRAQDELPCVIRVAPFASVAGR